MNILISTLVCKAWESLPWISTAILFVFSSVAINSWLSKILPCYKRDETLDIRRQGGWESDWEREIEGGKEERGKEKKRTLSIIREETETMRRQRRKTGTSGWQVTKNVREKNKMKRKGGKFPNIKFKQKISNIE